MVDSQTQTGGQVAKSKLTYLAYLAVFLVLVALLWLSSDTPAPEAPEIGVSGSVEEIVEGVAKVVEGDIPRVRRLAEDDAWRIGIRAVRQRLEADAFDVVPPAARPVAASVGAADPDAPVRLEISTPNGKPAGEEIFLNFAHGPHRTQRELTGLPITVDTVRSGSEPVELSATVVVATGFLGFGRSNKRWTDPLTLDLSQMAPGEAVLLEMSGRFSIGGRDKPKWDSLPISVVTMPVPRGGAGDDDGGRQSPQVLRPAEADRLISHAGDVSIAADIADNLLVPATGPMTFALVWSKADPNGLINAERSDSAGPIGVFAPNMPLFAAAADGWASLRIRAGVTLEQGDNSYLVLAASGNRETARELILAFVGRHLTTLSFDGAPAANRQLADAMRWSACALGVPLDSDSFTDLEDAEAAEALRAIMQIVYASADADRCPETGHAATRN